MPLHRIRGEYFRSGILSEGRGGCSGEGIIAAVAAVAAVAAAAVIAAVVAAVASSVTSAVCCC